MAKSKLAEFTAQVKVIAVMDVSRCCGQRNQDTKTIIATTEKPKAFSAAAGR